MAAGDLVTSNQALAALGLTADTNSIVAGIISAVSTQIQNFVGYQFATASYTRTFNGMNSDRLLLPDRPVLAVTAVTVDTIVIPQAAPPSPGFLWDAKFVYLIGSCAFRGWEISRFSRGLQNVTIAYTAGYAAVPADIQQAALNWIGSAYALVGQDPSVKMMRAGDTQIEWGNLLTVLSNATLLIPPAIAAALLPYCRVASS